MQEFFFRLDDGTVVRVRASNADVARAFAQVRFPGRIPSPISASDFNSAVSAGAEPVELQTTLIGLDPLTGVGTQAPGAGIPNIGGGGEEVSGSTAATNPADVVTTPSDPGPGQTLLERELAAPQAAFRNFAAQRGLPTRGVVGSRVQGAASPAVDLVSLGQALGTSPASFTNFLENSIGSQGVTRGLGQQASNILAQLAAQNPAGGEFSARLQPFLSPESFGSNAAEAVRNAALSALGGQSPFLAAQFGNQIDQEVGRRFQDRVFAENQPVNFAGFLRSQLRV